MTRDEFIASAWNNGTHSRSGAGYGIKIGVQDRDRFFDRSWPSVELQIPGFPDATSVRIAKASMWNGTCRELIHKNIGLWLRGTGSAPWRKGQPPKVRVRQVGERAFKLDLA